MGSVYLGDSGARPSIDFLADQIASQGFHTTMNEGYPESSARGFIVIFQHHDFDVETATNVDRVKELLKAGFDYIAERGGIMLFRRPKLFGSIGVTSAS